MQLCPAWLNPATLIFAAADFQSLSASMITGALLPSSNPTFLRGALARMSQPTGGEPVNVINAMPGWSTIALPTVEPLPTTTCSHSAGRPHSSMSIPASASELNGVCDAGFSTTGQPAAIAGATLWTTRLSGKLNGAIAPITPIGTRRVNPSLPSPACEGVERHDVAGQRARLGGGEPERADGALGLRPCGLDRLGRLVGDDPGELLQPLGRAARRRGRGSRPAATAAAAGRAAPPLRWRRRGRRRLRWTSAPPR